MLALSLFVLPATGKEWQWVDQSEDSATALGKEFLNEAIDWANKGSDFSTAFGAIAIALFMYADHLENNRHNAAQEEWQRQMLQNTTRTANKFY